MANGRQNWALLAVISALAVAASGHLRAAEPASADHNQPPQSVAPEELAGEAEYLPAAGPYLGVPGTCPPVRFASYPKAATSLWYFLAEGMALKRDANDNRDFAADDAGNVVLGTQDLQFDFPAGLRAVAGCRLGDWAGFEVSYFGMFDWAEGAAVRDSTPNAAGGVGNLFSPFSDFGNPLNDVVDQNNLASISYASSLDNFEWNFRRALMMPPDGLQVSILLGGRYMEIDERLDYFTASDTPIGLGATNSVGTATQNDMLGAQIGALFEFYVDPGWWIDVELKGVAFDNRARQNTTYVRNVGGVEATFPSARTERRTTFALDLDLTLSCQVNSWLTARVGYQAIWIDGLAVASGNFQPDLDILTLGPPSLNHDGKVVYHGLHIGLTGVW